MLLIEIAKHDFESQMRSKTIDKASYNLRAYDFTIFTYKCSKALDTLKRALLFKAISIFLRTLA